MKVSEFAEGLAILRKTMKDGDGYHLCAEHDQIFVHLDDGTPPLSPTDVQRLRALGWFQEGEEDERDDSDGTYLVGEGWSAFV